LQLLKEMHYCVMSFASYRIADGFRLHRRRLHS